MIKRSDTGSWATSGWLYAEGVLYICWRTFSFDGPICALVHLFATSPSVQEVYIYNTWGLSVDWGYILQICCLIPPEKLALSNAYYACLSKFLENDMINGRDRFRDLIPAHDHTETQPSTSSDRLAIVHSTP